MPSPFPLVAKTDAAVNLAKDEIINIALGLLNAQKNAEILPPAQLQLFFGCARDAIMNLGVEARLWSSAREADALGQALLQTSLWQNERNILLGELKNASTLVIGAITDLELDQKSTKRKMSVDEQERLDIAEKSLKGAIGALGAYRQAERYLNMQEDVTPRPQLDADANVQSVSDPVHQDWDCQYCGIGNWCICNQEEHAGYSDDEAACKSTGLWDVPTGSAWNEGHQLHTPVQSIKDEVKEEEFEDVNSGSCKQEQENWNSAAAFYVKDERSRSTRSHAKVEDAGHEPWNQEDTTVNQEYGQWNHETPPARKYSRYPATPNGNINDWGNGNHQTASQGHVNDWAHVPEDTWGKASVSIVEPKPCYSTALAPAPQPNLHSANRESLRLADIAARRLTAEAEVQRLRDEEDRIREIRRVQDVWGLRNTGFTPSD